MESLHNRFENVIPDCIAKPVSEEVDSSRNADDLVDALLIKQNSLTVVEASKEISHIALGACLVTALPSVTMRYFMFPFGARKKWSQALSSLRPASDARIMPPAMKDARHWQRPIVFESSKSAFGRPT